MFAKLFFIAVDAVALACNGNFDCGGKWIRELEGTV